LLDRSSQFSGVQSRALVRAGGNPRNLPQIYIPKGKGSLPEIYLRDAGPRRLISSLKWFISTCIVGAAGLCIIAVAMYASTDQHGNEGIFTTLTRVGREALKAKTPGTLVAVDPRDAKTGEKTDKAKTSTKGTTTKHIIQDSVVERRNSREFIQVKPYVRIVALLSTSKPDNTDAIPPLNPFDLYTDKGPETSKPAQQPAAPANTPLVEHVSAKLIDLAGGFLPEEDGQELTDVEIERYVAEADAFYAENAAQMRPAIMPGSEDEADSPENADQPPTVGVAIAGAEKVKLPPHTTILEKLVEEEEGADESVVESAIVKSGDTVASVLKNAGVTSWQAQSINDALTAGGLKLRAGQEIRMKLAAGSGEDGAKEPLKVSVFSGIKPEASVERAMDGEYGLTDDPVEVAQFKQDDDDDRGNNATLYTSIYSAALAQDLSPDIINKLLRTLTYDVDYKQRVRPGDSFELFFDVKQDDAGGEKAGELLYVSMTVGGVSNKYYRFRTPDGAVDFYNDRGSNSRKFLMQMPVKAGRFTSGFGFRRHPLLGIRKVHTGIDWAAPTGTPIMAAGDGTIEIAERHGGNGNYIRIRHGNGYKTAYSHMSRFMPNIKKGMKIRQGMQIGFVGTTGMSTGPHLHYEVLVNNRFTNPLKVRVPRSRQLNGRMLAEFKKEEGRIDELMKRSPVKTRIAAAHE
jgi:murein DD-endopeptidase MepM/ murein hydrolase activator NlpD